jgi:antitoxin (DNA-binding transcriptional repressor) of toxin-antitoxin stability system
MSNMGCIMKTMTIRDVRLNWPEAERELATVGEIIVTRDAKPVARLLPWDPPKKRRKRFDAAAHLRWLRRFWAGQRRRGSIDEELASDRADRRL